MNSPVRGVLGLSHLIGETRRTYDWTLTLPVPAAKRELLRNQDATEVDLYLTETRGVPVEYIRHRPSGDTGVAEPPAKISLGGESLVIRVPELAPAESLLKQLGFKAASCPRRWVLQSRLFKSVTADLLVDAGSSARPLVDDPGLTCISLLVKSLDAVGQSLPLTAYQDFELDGVRKEIAFFSGNGLLLEFLRVRGRRAAG